MGALDGKAALVTGGGSGIGLGCAVRFAAEGAAGTICGRTEERLTAAADTISGQVQTVVCDVTDEAQVEAAVAKSAEPTGTLDVVLASAGGSETIGPLPTIDADAFRRTIELNVTGTFLCIKH